MDRNIAELQALIDAAEPDSIVFFGGAGVSTESGIPDFRSANGLFSPRGQRISPEELVSRPMFDADPRLFYDFYFDKMIFPDARPNAAHRKLAELEARGKLSAVITQNIDGLHQKAGSRVVYELHGSVHRNSCMECSARYDLDAMLALHHEAADGIPRCPACGGMVKPDVVLYGESLDQQVLNASIRAISQARTLIIAGTSLVVYPAAALIDYFSGDDLVVINLSPGPRDRFGDLCIEGKVGEVLGKCRI